MAYRFINSQGETVTTKTVKEFAERFNFSASLARQLAAGCRSRLRGWCSTSKRAKVKKHRARFMTKLVNTKTGETCILGSSIKSFAEQRGLCDNELWKLVNGRKLRYRGWCLQRTLEAASSGLGDTNF